MKNNMLKWLWILSLYKFWFLSIKAHVPSCGRPVMLILLRSPLFLLLFSGQSYFSTCASLHLNCFKFPRHCFLPFSVVQKMKYNIHFCYSRCPSDRPLSLGTTDKAKSRSLFISWLPYGTFSVHHLPKAHLMSSSPPSLTGYYWSINWRL